MCLGQVQSVAAFQLCSTLKHCRLLLFDLKSLWTRRKCVNNNIRMFRFTPSSIKDALLFSVHELGISCFRRFTRLTLDAKGYLLFSQDQCNKHVAFEIVNRNANHRCMLYNTVFLYSFADEYTGSRACDTALPAHYWASLRRGVI